MSVSKKYEKKLGYLDVEQVVSIGDLEWFERRLGLKPTDSEISVSQRVQEIFQEKLGKKELDEEVEANILSQIAFCVLILEKMGSGTQVYAQLRRRVRDQGKYRIEQPNTPKVESLCELIRILIVYKSFFSFESCAEVFRFIVNVLEEFDLSSEQVSESQLGTIWKRNKDSQDLSKFETITVYDVEKVGKVKGRNKKTQFFLKPTSDDP